LALGETSASISVTSLTRAENARAAAVPSSSPYSFIAEPQPAALITTWSSGGSRPHRALGGSARGSSGGPSAQERAKSSSLVVAEALDGQSRVLARHELTGPNPYTFTGEIMAWAAVRAAQGKLQGAGALGPVDGFGLDALVAGCAAAGLA